MSPETANSIFGKFKDIRATTTWSCDDFIAGILWENESLIHFRNKMVTRAHRPNPPPPPPPKYLRFAKLNQIKMGWQRNYLM